MKSHPTSPSALLFTAARVALAGSAIGIIASAGQAPSASPEYSLVRADEFDRDGKLDPSDWAYERGFVRNEELQ